MTQKISLLFCFFNSQNLEVKGFFDTHTHTHQFIRARQFNHFFFNLQAKLPYPSG
jgi:hypothetical protein